MGYDAREIRIVGVCSAHNSIKDATDQAKWVWLRKQIDALIENHYDDLHSLGLDVAGPSND